MNEQNEQNEQINNIEDFERNKDNIINMYKPNIENKINEAEVKKTASKIISKISNITNTTYEQSAIGVCLLLQIGGHLKGVENRKITIEKQEYSKKELMFASEQVDNKYTLRTIARSLKEIIAYLAIKYNIPGNLYAQYKTAYPQFNPLENPSRTAVIAAYCTDFQIDNPETPQSVREFLLNRTKNRSNENSKKK